MLALVGGREDPSGMIVYPKLPVPTNRQSEPKVNAMRGGSGKWIAAVLAAIAIGGGAGYFFAPSKSKQLAAATQALEVATSAAKVEADRADGAKKQLDVVTKDKLELETKLAAASSRLAENEKLAADANASAKKKLQAAVDTANGEVSTEGEEIHLKLVDKVLFSVGDDQLTDKGKAVLARVGKALKDLPDKQIWVQGHTDDTPIVAPAPPPTPPKKKGKAKRVEKPEPVVPAGPRFASNWELSAARALQVVHYLQEVAKLEPTRLAALAFGEYRPLSRTNKALNRRIEIVLYPHKAVIDRAKKR